MALTAIAQDFEVKQGLIVLGTGTVTSSTGNTSTLQVNGGAAIAKNLIVGSTTTLYGSLFAEDISASGKVIITDTTAATSTPDGALQVLGGVYIGNNAIVSSVAATTATVAGNALVVSGGVGIAGSLYVQGAAVFENDVLFTGETTYVFSTNTVYTDNLIELHTHANGIGGAWTVDDGLDIGLRFHYYNGADLNAALILANDTKWLEWYEQGTETDGVFTSTTYGTFKTGNLVLTGNANISGTITATNFVGVITTATNLAGGTNGSLVYQSAPGQTTFLAPSTSGYLLQTNGAGTAPSWVALSGVSAGSATTATNLAGGTTGTIPYQTDSGATTFSSNLQYINGTNTLQVTNIATTGTTNATSTTTGALVVTGGVGIGGNLYVGGTIYGTVTNATTATNILGGTAGQVPYQVSPGVTSFYGPGTAGQLLVSNGTSAPVYTSTGSIYVGRATLADSATQTITTATNANATYYPTFVDSNNATATAETVYTTSSFTINAQSGNVAVASTTPSTLPTNGALVVTGGVGIGGDTNIAGILKVTEASNSNSLVTGSIQTAGGVAVTKDVYVGGAITAGATAAATTSTVVPALYSNNLLLATFTKPNISGTTLQNLDVYSSTAYRSAKYFIQIVDGTSIHITEITVFHDGTNVYINEYGISTNNGQLGSFDAVLGGGSVTLTFTPSGATNMSVKVVRMGISI